MYLLLNKIFVTTDFFIVSSLQCKKLCIRDLFLNIFSSLLSIRPSSDNGNLNSNLKQKIDNYRNILSGKYRD